MQFIPHGPYIPSQLLHDHEEGRVVFFCGAGISQAANLPLFKELVEKIYTELNTDRISADAVLEKEAFDKCEYDTTLHLLEQRYPGGKAKVREAVAKILHTNSHSITTNHQSLLQLATHSSGKVRLITTNYDHLFEYVAENLKTKHGIYSAPHLPVPKPSEWSGLVYLHGILPANADLELPKNISLNDLVLTSADFGKAYLTERWAARFISELFRSYTVCFVGYGLNDPILRYMTDALAADSVEGNTNYQAYAFTSAKNDKGVNKVNIKWRAKGITPIIYSDANNHQLLTDTLTTWGKNYSLGSTGYAQIVTNYANVKPLATTQEDDYVGRMLWALSEPSGQAAFTFAEHQPLPDFGWFKELTNNKHFALKDLPRFGVQGYQPHGHLVQQEISFSMLHRPNSASNAAWQSLIGQSPFAKLDAVSWQLARWLVRYLHEPDLLLWAVNLGSYPHEKFSYLINQTLKEDIPHGTIPMPMGKLWQLYLAGYIASNYPKLASTHSWLAKFRNYGLTLALKTEFALLIQPKIFLSKRYTWNDYLAETGEEAEQVSGNKRIKDFINAEVGLEDNKLRYFLYKIRKTEDGAEACAIKSELPSLLAIIESALLETLELMLEVEETRDGFDNSCFHLPSIEPHWQNRHHHSWTVLIELLRDGILELAQQNKIAAHNLAVTWFQQPHLFFKRLALYAAGQGIVDNKIWLSWLLTNNHGTLWDIRYLREVCRLLVNRGNAITKPQLKQLESAILKGRVFDKSFAESLNQAQLEYEQAKSIWVRLLKLQQSGAQISQQAQAKFNETIARFPEYFLPHEHQREEFKHWMQGSWDPGGYESCYTEVVPKPLPKLLKWLQADSNTKSNYFRESAWREFCKRYPLRALTALNQLGNNGLYPAFYWNILLGRLAKNPIVAKKSWRYISAHANHLTSEQLGEVTHNFAWWLWEAAKTFTEDQPAFYTFVKSLVAACLAKGEPTDTYDKLGINHAINHPLGLTAQAIFTDIFKNQPTDGAGLNKQQQQVLELLVHCPKPVAANAKFIIGEQAISLFRLDEPWTIENIIPQFNWQQPVAIYYWSGFLLAPRNNLKFLALIKPAYLEAVKHYEQLDPELAGQLTRFTINLQLSNTGYFTAEELVSFFNLLPKQGLGTAAHHLALNQAHRQNKEAYWQEVIKPFYKNYWPKNVTKITQETACTWLQLVLATGDKLPDALATLKPQLTSEPSRATDLYAVKESDICETHPEQALELITTLMPNNYPHGTPIYLHECLTKIQQTNPSLTNQPEFKRLTNLS